MLRKTLPILVALLSLVAFLPPTARAADYPTRPVTLTVAFTPGGASDVLARIVARKMEQVLGEPIVIDNRPGAGGNVAAEAVARATPDGYTILAGNNAILATNAALYKKISFDAEADFAPIGLIGSQANILVVNPSVPAHSMAELIALAKERPGKLNFASSGYGLAAHLAGELFNEEAKIDIVHVPYRGAAPAVNDLLGQQVQMTFLDLPVILPQIKAGTLRPIALGGRERAATAPDVPTTAEAGMPDLIIENWYGMVAPAGTSPAIVARLNKIATEAMADPAVKAKLAEQGLTLVGDTPEHFRDFIAADIKKRAKVIQDAGVVTTK